MTPTVDQLRARDRDAVRLAATLGMLGFEVSPDFTVNVEGTEIGIYEIVDAPWLISLKWAPPPGR